MKKWKKIYHYIRWFSKRKESKEWVRTLELTSRLNIQRCDNLITELKPLLYIKYDMEGEYHKTILILERLKDANDKIARLSEDILKRSLYKKYISLEDFILITDKIIELKEIEIEEVRK